jgi:hypothetical protein
LGRGKEWAEESVSRENLQIPRPIKEKRNDAYRETWGGIWNSRRAVAVTAQG